MKKILLWLLAVPMMVFGVAALAPAPAEAQFTRPNNLTDYTNGGETEWLDVVGQGAGQGDAFVTVVRNFVNWMLGILALIALLVLLYGGFQMVTAAGNEDQYGQWFKILKQAAAGLAMIGIAWFVISIIFFVISLAVTNAPADSWSTQWS